MSDSWQSAWVEILPDFSNFRNRTNSTITPILSQAGNTAGNKFGLNFVSVLGGFLGGNILTGIGYTIGRVLSDAISTAVNFGLDGIQLASGLGEQVNAVQVQFGEFADEILALSEDAPSQLNLTRAAFDKLAVRFGSFARTIAGSGGDVAKVIDDLTTRGADFASVYDIEASEALELFQSGLAGETEPLRRFGLDLSAASVQAFAYANGIGTVGQQLTEAEKIQARYGSLMAQTNVVAGDLTNTFGSLANQQRQFDVQLAEAQTSLGEILLPGFASVVTYANTTLLPKLSEVIERVGPKLAAAFEDSSPEIKALGEDLIGFVDETVDAFADGGLEDVITLIGDLVDFGGQLKDAWVWANDPNAQPAKFLNDLQDGLNAATKAIYDFTHGIGNSPLQNLFDPLSMLPDSTLDELEARGEAAGTHTVAGLTAGIGTFNPAQLGSGLGENFSAGLAFGISKGQSGVISAATKVAQSAVNAVKALLKISSPSKVMAELGAFAAEGFSLGWDDNQPIMSPGVRIPSPASGFGVSPSGAGAVGLDPTSLMRALRDYAERDVTVDVDGVTVARAAISGSARLAASGAF